MPPPAQSCANCIFFELIKDNKGNCRRYPPQTSTESSDRGQSKFPLVTVDNWCGEWSKEKK